MKVGAQPPAAKPLVHTKGLEAVQWYSVHSASVQCRGGAGAAGWFVAFLLLLLLLLGAVALLAGPVARSRTGVVASSVLVSVSVSASSSSASASASASVSSSEAHWLRSQQLWHWPVSALLIQ